MPVYTDCPHNGTICIAISHGVKVETKAACVELECFSSSIIRVKKYPLGQAPEKQSLSVTMQPEKVKYKIQEANNQGNTYYFRTDRFAGYRSEPGSLCD